MNVLKSIRLEFHIISSTIKEYTKSGNIIGILDGLDQALAADDLESVEYYFNALYNWYKANIDDIRNNNYAFNKADHERNYELIAKLKSQLEKEITSNDMRIKKGSKLHTAFDEFEVLRIIGQGGNGTVYEAIDSFGKHVAIKVVDVANIGTEKKKRFKNEINFCQHVHHPNIVEVLDVGSTENGRYAFYVMPLYKDTLRDRIKEGIRPEDAIELFDSILAGLAFSHEKKVYHRDIKPENIFVVENSNRCVIGDFGIAHFPSEEMITTVETKVGNRMANFQYAAPEQRVKGTNVDGRADVFAAGLILNEMLTGQLIGGNGYKEISEKYPDYGYLDKIVEQLYKQDPDDRLYPPARIRHELQARIESASKNTKTQEISEALRKAEEASDPYTEYKVPKVEGARVEDNRLIIVLDTNIPTGWYDIFRNGTYGHTSVMGYGPEKFTLRNKKELYVSLRNTDNRNTIQNIMIYFRQWLETVTSLYNSKQKSEIERKKREEINRLKNEIELNERSKSLNEFVQTLI